MSELPHLIATLKRLLKAQGLTYRDVAKGLEVSRRPASSDSSRQSASRWSVSNDQWHAGYTLSELLAEVGTQVERVAALTPEQEAQLVRDEKLMLVAVCAFNHWTVQDIISAYTLTRPECLKRLLVLDRMGLIALLPATGSG